MISWNPTVRALTVVGLSVAATACVQLDPEASERLATSASGSPAFTGSGVLEPGSSSPILTAVRDPARPKTDREQDARRHAAEVLAFFGIEPGMVVLDLFSGGGYYAELLSYAVGPAGRVVAHNNTPYLSSAEDELATRYAPGRLANVERIVADNNQLELTPERFDAVIMIKVYHDVYFVSEEMGWEQIDGPRLLDEIFRALKPGGVLGIVDHVAAPGSPPETGGTLHRIDLALIRRDMAAAGFVFDGQSDVLRNPADDYSQSVFAPTVRNRTDRAVLRFRKPWRQQEGDR